jgi:hypothetical protein
VTVGFRTTAAANPAKSSRCRSRILISYAGNVGGGIREPTSRSNYQTTRVMAASVAAFDELISMQPRASSTTGLLTLPCRRFRRAPPGSTSG